MKYCSKKLHMLFFHALVLICLTGCGSALIKENLTVKTDTTRVGGEFLLHDNPQPGDYAVYRVNTEITTGTQLPKILKMESEDTYEVVSVKKDQVIVKVSKRTVKVDTYSRGSIDKYSPDRDMYMNMGINEELFYLSPDGQILKAVFSNRTQGVKKEYGKSEPGQEGYIKYTDPVKSGQITVSGTAYDAELITCSYPVLTMKKFDDSKRKGYWIRKGQTDVSVYVSPEVKFSKIKSELKSSQNLLVDMMAAGSNGTWTALKTTSVSTTVITEELVKQGSKEK